MGNIISDTLDSLLIICADCFGVSVEEVKSRCQRQELVDCRKAYSLISKELFGIKNEIIAERICKTHQAVSSYISEQPTSRYYSMCLSQVRKNTESFKNL